MPADMSKREAVTYTPVHIINIEIADNHEEATLGALQIADLCEFVSLYFVNFFSFAVERHMKNAAPI